MDIKRSESVVRNKRIKRLIYLGIVLIGASAVTMGLSRMKPAAPTVDRGTLWIDSVKRGAMLVTVRGLGTLVPEEVRIIPATRDGIVEQKRVKIGDTVNADTILIVLTNPDLLQQLANDELAYQKANADLLNTRAQLDTQVINQKSDQATKENAALQAKIQADTDEELFKEGLGPEVNVRKSKANAQSLANEVLLEKQRLDTLLRANQAQLDAQDAQVQ